MEISQFHTFPLNQTTGFLSKKVSFITSDGKNTEFFITFDTHKVSADLRDDIQSVANQKIQELIEDTLIFDSKYEVELTDKNFN